MQQTDDTWWVVQPLLFSIRESVYSLSMLAQAGRVQDCYAISRQIYETAVNAAFILAGGPSAAMRAKQHALQKTYRENIRVLEINDPFIQVAPNFSIDISQHPALQAALAEFTSKKGREITPWTPETVEQRVEAIGQRYGRFVAASLKIALFGIYRNASEVVHGTLFGSLLLLGFTRPQGPPDSEAALEKYRRGLLCMLLMLIGTTLNSLIEVIAQELDVPELTQRSRDLFNPIKSEPWNCGANDSEGAPGEQATS